MAPQRRGGGSVEVTTPSDDPLQRGQQVLEHSPGAVTADVLDEDEPSAGAENAGDLSERRVLVGNGAEHQRGHHDIDTIGTTKASAGPGLRSVDQHGKRELPLRDASLQAATHRGVRLGQQEPVETGVVIEVEPGPSANFEDGATDC